MPKIVSDKSTSKTSSREKLEWVRLKGKDAEDKVIELLRQGYSLSHAGVILRDVYGIPKIKYVTGKKMLKIARDHGLEPKIPDDLLFLIKKAVNLTKHLEKHPKDLSNKRGLQVVESKINSLVRYYKRIGRLPKDWKYSPESAELLSK